MIPEKKSIKITSCVIETTWQAASRSGVLLRILLRNLSGLERQQGTQYVVCFKVSSKFAVIERVSKRSCADASDSAQQTNNVSVQDV
jgi:hypothetical protein